MFFFTRHLHVEDAKRITDFNSSGKVLQVFVYHATEHNLRSQVFRSQLLEHLASNLTVLLLRRSDLHFPGMLAFFMNGCTIELKQKLKVVHERAVNVFNDCYEDAVLELVKEVKRIQESTFRKRYVVPQTFPVVIGDAVTSLTFGMSVKDVCVESVFELSDQKKIAVKLVKKPDQKSGKRDRSRLKTHKPERSTSETDLSGPLAVKGIELRMRKTVLKEKKFSTIKRESKELSNVKEKQAENSIFVSLKEAAAVEILPDVEEENPMSDENARRPSDDYDDDDDDVQSSNSSTATLNKNSTTDANMNYDSLLQPHSTIAIPQCKTPAPKSIIPDCNFDYQDDKDIFADEQIHETRTYAMYIPDHWGNNGEQLIYITFPDETDKIAGQMYDFSLSGFSTPSSLNLSEECLSPVESPLISVPDTKKTIYPQPCPVYPLESSFPPVDLPVDFATS